MLVGWIVRTARDGWAAFVEAWAECTPLSRVVLILLTVPLVPIWFALALWDTLAGNDR